jgi:hypothetical protein
VEHTRAKKNGPDPRARSLLVGAGKAFTSNG